MGYHLLEMSPAQLRVAMRRAGIVRHTKHCLCCHSWKSDGYATFTKEEIMRFPRYLRVGGEFGANLTHNYKYTARKPLE